MRRSLWIALAIVSLGCPRNEPALPVIEEEEGPAELLSSVNVADPRASTQLLGGFHTLEQQAWRWTEKRFAVALQPPPPVEDHQTAVTLRFSLPQVVIDEVGPVTLNASIDEQPLGAETYSQAGEGLVFSKPVPAELLGEQPVQVQFELDKAIPPNERDGRELGIIVSSIALE